MWVCKAIYGDKIQQRIIAASSFFYAPLVPKLTFSARLILYPTLVLAGLAAVGIAIALIVLAMAYPNLPSLEVLTDYRPKIPLRIYTADGHLIGEYGEERRAVVGIADVPPVMKHAGSAPQCWRTWRTMHSTAPAMA